MWKDMKNIGKEKWLDLMLHGLSRNRKNAPALKKYIGIILKGKMRRAILTVEKRLSLNVFGTAVKLITPVLCRSCQFLFMSEFLFIVNILVNDRRTPLQAG
jgi:hypothetical protein